MRGMRGVVVIIVTTMMVMTVMVVILSSVIVMAVGVRHGVESGQGEARFAKQLGGGDQRQADQGGGVA